MQTTTGTRKMVQLAILVAITLILAFTPLGYLKAGFVEITFMIVPVSVAAIVLGPVGGAIIGGVFGVTSFIQCFGMSAFGVLLLGISPIATFVTCIIPRILCGFLAGIIFNLISRSDKTKIVSYIVAALSTALLNTLFFMGCVSIFFWKNPAFTSKMSEWGLATDSLWIFLIAFVGINGVIEAVANATIGAAVAKAADKVTKRI